MWWGVLGMAAWVVFWALVVLLVVSLVRSRTRESTHRPTAALRVLEERYARGEITAEELAERRAVLIRRDDRRADEE